MGSSKNITKEVTVYLYKKFEKGTKNNFFSFGNDFLLVSKGPKNPFQLHHNFPNSIISTINQDMPRETQQANKNQKNVL